MTYKELENAIEQFLDFHNVDNSGALAEWLAFKLKSQGLYLEEEQDGDSEQ